MLCMSCKSWENLLGDNAMLQIRRGNRDNLRIISPISSLKHFVNHHQNRLVETVLMRGHNMFYREIWKIIFEVSLKSPSYLKLWWCQMGTQCCTWLLVTYWPRVKITTSAVWHGLWNSEFCRSSQNSFSFISVILSVSFLGFMVKINDYLLRTANTSSMSMLIHCILVDSSTVIYWTSPFVNLRVSGQFCCLNLVLIEEDVFQQSRPWSDTTLCGVWSGSALFAYDTFTVG